jgi:putative signal transducing protein
MTEQLTRVFVANGEVQAQQVRAFLEAAGVATIERGEALRNTHGLTLDGLGAVEIFVPSEQADEARTLINSAEAGSFRVDETDDAADAGKSGGEPPQPQK